MEIFNRPPSIAEDTLHYTLRPQPSQSSKSAVTSLAALIHAYAQQLLPDFIWHRDPFELKTVQDAGNRHNKQGDDSGWYLEGRMRVGDSVDDEWCVVWLLWEVSSRWDVAISVNDSDGEFLLIEAAESLPSWVEPSIAENRVWIYRSKLHLVPLSYESPPSTKPKRVSYEDEEVGGSAHVDSDEGWLNIPDALKALWSDDDDTEAPKEVQESIVRRISGYPEASLLHRHVTKVYVPVDVARALSQEPSLVQRAAEAFYTRDPLQLRVTQRMSRFPPQNSIITTIKISRTAYAQLSGQKFHPPRVFPPITEPEGTREWKWKDIGMKIACGFEILYQESKARSSSTHDASVSAEARLDALRRNPEFTQYLEKLVSAGYFKNELKGSALWNELERKAADIFVKTRQESDTLRPTFASLVNEAISRADSNPIPEILVEEPDGWLSVNAEDFDAKLAQVMQAQPRKGGGDGNTMDVDNDIVADTVAQVQAKKLKGLARKIENFVEGEGTLDGAVLDDDVLSEDEKLSDFSDGESTMDSGDSEPKNDDGEAKARREAMDKLVAGIDPLDYGKMPPLFYKNSQRTTRTTLDNETVPSTSSPATGTSNSNNSPLTPLKEVPRRPVRPPILPRDKFDGVDSDDETDEEDPVDVDSEDEEDQPQVVGEVEIDMVEEQEEFLNFSRELLGISDEQWLSIVREREDRGAFVPRITLKADSSMNAPTAGGSQIQKEMQSGSRTIVERPEAGTHRKANSIYSSFDEVMDRMEAELAKARSSKKGSPNERRASEKHTTTSDAPHNRSGVDRNKGKERQHAGEDKTEDEGTDDELENAMDAELRAALAREDSDSEEDEPMDYNLMKNFLESFKSQGGLSGPVSNLAGRLEPGWRLPRDTT